MRLPLLIAAVFTLAAGPALAQQQRIDPKDLKAPPKLPEMAAPSNIAGMIAQVDQENILVLDLSSGGRVKIVMRPDVAPKHVERIRTLARQGFYDGTAFHRIVRGFMIQGGDPLTKDSGMEARWGTGDPGYKIKAEFNGKPHVKGIVSMARSADPDSAGSQFFICFDTAPHLDRQYTVFARVLSGMDVLEKLEKVPQRASKPQTPVVLESVTLLPRAEWKPAAK